jgi:hypothetical protein
MQRISFRRLVFWVGPLLAAAAAGCGDPFGQKATVDNVVDTLTLYALRDTPIRLPSAYDMIQKATVRTDNTPEFDFAFDVAADGTPLVYPRGALGLSAEPGLLLMAGKTFEEVRRAPDSGYRADSALAVKAGDVFVARSRISPLLCLYVSVPRYGKFHVLSVDVAARRIVLESLVDLNCGFRGLEPGLPGS